MSTVQEIPDSVKARLGAHSLHRLDRYLAKSADDRERGRKLCRDMEWPWAPRPQLTDAEMMEVSRNLDRAATAQEKRERRAAKKAENQRRTQAGKIPID